MKKTLYSILSLSILTASLIFTGCQKEQKTGKSIAVFVPGIMADSATYAKLAKGVQEGADEFNKNKSENEKATVYILEAGTNQAEWQQKITSLAAAQKYDVIISSNPSLPDLVKPLVEQFPTQKFILLDAECEGNDNIATVCYNQYQQAYVTGYIAGLMSKSHKLALISAQDYPVMNNIIFPYFAKGGEDAVKGTTAEYRVVGNWYDATKGAELADAVAKKGIDVILPVCGGAAQGVLSSAVNNKIHIAWFDANGFTNNEGTVISSTILKQDVMARESTIKYLEGKTEWGTAKMVGMEDGYVEFIQDNQAYIKSVPEEIRKTMSELVNKITTGEIILK